MILSTEIKTIKVYLKFFQTHGFHRDFNHPAFENWCYKEVTVIQGCRLFLLHSLAVFYFHRPINPQAWEETWRISLCAWFCVIFVYSLLPQIWCWWKCRPLLAMHGLLYIELNIYHAHTVLEKTPAPKKKPERIFMSAACAFHTLAWHPCSL